MVPRNTWYIMLPGTTDVPVHKVKIEKQGKRKH